MDRADGLGTGVAVVGHVALFAALSLGLAASVPPEPAPPPAMEVEFVDTVSLEPVAAPSADAMAQAEAPETGTPEEAMPQPAPVPEPLPLAPAPEPVPAPPVPAPPKPKPPEPRPAPRAAPKPAPPGPAPVQKTVAAKPHKPAPAKQAAARPAPAKSAPAKPAQTAGAGTKTAARAPRLGRDLLAGLSDPSPGKADKPQALAISANAMAGIVAAIKRQVQPCANRQVNPGPGANRISVRLQLRLNRDGSLASAPKVVSTSGVDEENGRYAKRVADLAIAAYTGCAPMRGLPEDLYRTAKGGWSNINLNYKLPG